MKRFLWQWAFVVLACGAAACSNSDTDPEWYYNKAKSSVVLDSAAAMDSAASYMSSAGCTVAGKSFPVGSALLPVGLAGHIFFDCHALPTDSLHHLIRNYHIWFRGLNPGEHVTSNNYWDVVIIPCNSSVQLGGGVSYRMVDAWGTVWEEGTTPAVGATKGFICSFFRASGPPAIAIATLRDPYGAPVPNASPYGWDDGPGGSSANTSDPSFATISPSVVSLAVGETLTFTASLFDSAGAPPTSVEFDYSPPSNGVGSMSGATVTAQSPGTGIVTATYTYGNYTRTATASITVRPYCGSSGDQFAAQLAAGIVPTVTCSVLPEDEANYAACLTTTNRLRCMAILVTAQKLVADSCLVGNQQPECLAFYAKLSNGDTSKVTLSVNQFNYVKEIVQNLSPYETDTNVVNPGNGIRYTKVRRFNTTLSSLGLIYGKLSIYYDEYDEPVSFYDRYDFTTDQGTFVLVAAVKAVVNDAMDGKGFKVVYP